MDTDAPPKEKFLNRKQAANYLTAHGFPISARTLARMACRKPAEGPPYHRFGWQSVVYPVRGLIEWAASHVEMCGTNLLRCPNCPHATMPRREDNPDVLFCREANRLVGNKRLVTVTPSWCPVQPSPF